MEYAGPPARSVSTCAQMPGTIARLSLVACSETIPFLNVEQLLLDR